MVIKSERKRESFGFDIFTNLNSIKIFDFINIGKQLKLDKKFIRFAILIGILVSTISKLPIPNRYFLFKTPLVIVILLIFWHIIEP